MSLPVRPKRDGVGLLFRWAWGLSLLVACATAPRPETPVPVRPVERSSIDAVLSHRAELQLTPDQIRQLETIDTKREQAVASLGGGPPRGERGRGGERSNGGGGQARPVGMGPASGGMGRGGPGRGGALGPARAALEPDEREREASRLRQLDDADTNAFLAADALFTDAQREPARIIASKYRAQLSDYREALKRRGESTDE